MTIEQSLIHSMITIGGLAHGRGITDSTLSKWVPGYDIFENLEKYCFDYMTNVYMK